MNHNVRTSSTPATSSSLRPRANRLISGLDEGDEVTFNPAKAPITRIASPVPSPFDSRAASPIPSTHLPRPSSSHGAQRGRVGAEVGRSPGGRQRKAGNESPSSLAGLWGNSWTALQGIASDLLGSDATSDTKPGTARTRKASTRTQSSRPVSYTHLTLPTKRIV